MALPTVAINSGGSDASASGAGPSVALTGALAATHTNTTVNITDAVDLSGVAVDGSAALWIASSSGRRWSGISAISGSIGNWTVTVVSAYANTESAKTWGIGGKRFSCAGSLQLFLDFLAGWTIDIQSGETITADIVVTPASQVTGLPAIITSSTFTTWGTQPLIQTATVGVAGLNLVSCAQLNISNLYLKCTVASGSQTEANSGIVPKTGNATYVSVANCIIDGFYHGIDASNNLYNLLQNLQVANCEIKNCIHHGIFGPGSSQRLNVLDCNLHNNSGYGANGDIEAVHTVFANNALGGAIGEGNAGLGGSSYVNCAFDSNGVSATSVDGGGLNVRGANSVAVINCIFWNNTSTVANYKGGIVGIAQNAVLINNSFGGPNQTYKFGDASGSESITKYNAFGTITLTGNPFNSSSDWGVNGTAGAGASCRAVAVQAPNASLNTAGDIGAIPSGGVSFIGGQVVPVGKTTGFF